MKICTCEDQSLAIIVISHNRLDILPEIVEGIAEQSPDELLIVSSAIKDAGFPFITVEPMTHTTADALVKRDAGFVATTSQYICYLADDHKLAPDFVKTFRERYAGGDWDILAPSRYTVRGQTIYPLPVGNVGEKWTGKPYAAGHCAVYRREWIRKLPFTAGPHHRNWDTLHSHLLVEKGARLAFAGTDLAVEDIEPGGMPWLG